MPESIRQQVHARMALSTIGHAKMAIVKAFRGQTFASAPLQNPPITGGMRDSWSKALDIASRDNAPSQAEYAQVSFPHPQIASAP